MKILIEIRGTSPLLMHNIRAANPAHPLAREMKKISSNRKYKATDEGQLELAKLDFMAGLYLDESGPYLPAENVQKCLIEGGRITKMGKQVERGLLIVDDAPLAYRGPRGAEELWAAEEFRNCAMVKVGQSRIPRTRAIFREWAAEVEAEMDGSLLNLAEFADIASAAGRSVGIGDRRPRYGRFEAMVTADV